MAAFLPPDAAAHDLNGDEDRLLTAILGKPSSVLELQRAFVHFDSGDAGMAYVWPKMPGVGYEIIAGEPKIDTKHMVVTGPYGKSISLYRYEMLQWLAATDEFSAMDVNIAYLAMLRLY